MTEIEDRTLIQGDLPGIEKAQLTILVDNFFETLDKVAVLAENLKTAKQEIMTEMMEKRCFDFKVVHRGTAYRMHVDNSEPTLKCSKFKEPK